MTLINVKGVKGEKGTGFEKAGDKGPFECGNCQYFDGSSCGQKDMIAESKEPKTSDGRISVAANDCCEYVDRVGKAPEKKPAFDLSQATWLKK